MAPDLPEEMADGVPSASRSIAGSSTNGSPSFGPASKPKLPSLRLVLGQAGDPLAQEPPLPLDINPFPLRSKSSGSQHASDHRGQESNGWPKFAGSSTGRAESPENGYWEQPLQGTSLLHKQPQSIIDHRADSLLFRPPFFPDPAAGTHVYRDGPAHSRRSSDTPHASYRGSHFVHSPPRQPYEHHRSSSHGSHSLSRPDLAQLSLSPQQASQFQAYRHQRLDNWYNAGPGPEPSTSALSMEDGHDLPGRPSRPERDYRRARLSFGAGPDKKTMLQAERYHARPAYEPAPRPQPRMYRPRSPPQPYWQPSGSGAQKRPHDSEMYRRRYSDDGDHDSDADQCRPKRATSFSYGKITPPTPPLARKELDMSPEEQSDFHEAALRLASIAAASSSLSIAAETPAAPSPLSNPSDASSQPAIGTMRSRHAPAQDDPAAGASESHSGSVGTPESSSGPSGVGTGKYICSVCKKRFTRPSALAVHSHMHTGEKPFKCDICDRSFSVNSNLRRHMRTHTKAERAGHA